MMAVPIELTPTLRVGRAMKLFDFELPQRGISGRTYDVSEVDGRFLLVKFLSQTAPETIDALDRAELVRGASRAGALALVKALPPGKRDGSTRCCLPISHYDGSA
jgi:hypothetical protein